MRPGARSVIGGFENPTTADNSRSTPAAAEPLVNDDLGCVINPDKAKRPAQ